MGSSGPGNFSDYSNYPRAIKGVTGAVDSEDKCALAFSTFIEDVDTCEYYSKKGCSRLLVQKSMLTSRSDW